MLQISHRRRRSLPAFTSFATAALFGLVGQPLPAAADPGRQVPRQAAAVARVAALPAVVPDGPAADVQVTATASGSADLAWNAANWGSSSAQTYTVLSNGVAVPGCQEISARTCHITGPAARTVSLVVRAHGDTAQEYVDAAAVTTTLLPPPTAPSGVTATATGSGTATVRWTAPNWRFNTGRTYDVLLDGAVVEACRALPAATTSCPITAAPGNHAVVVRANGSPGLSTNSSSTPFAIVVAPDAPTGIRLTASDVGSGTIAWTAPNFRGNTHNGYTVTVDDVPVDACTDITATTCSFTADSLSVRVVVTAIGDAANLTADSAPVTLTLLPAPDAPTGLTAGNYAAGSARVTWSPTSFNGSEYNRYTVLAGGNAVAACTAITATQCTITGTPDSNASVVVRAIGDEGLYTDSAPLVVGLPDLPDEPTAVNVVSRTASATRVGWTAPASWHRNTTRTYTVLADGVAVCTAITVTHCDLTGRSDTSPTVVVRAVGNAPALQASAAGVSVDIPGVPEAPANVRTTATGAGTATVVWDAPNWRHNTHRGYTVSVDGSPVMACTDITATTCDISGAGTVAVTVVAVGDDAATLTSAESTPLNVPLIAVPTGQVDTVTVTAVAGNPQVTVSWTTLDAANGNWNGGSTNDYVVTVTGPSGAQLSGPCVAGPVAAGPTPSCTFTTDVGGTYTARVTAANEAGRSTTHTDGSDDLVLDKPAGQVANLDVVTVADSGYVEVTWSRLPTLNWNGATSREYIVTVAVPGNETLTSNTCTSGAVADTSTPNCHFTTDLAGEYTVTVTPVSEAGTGTGTATATGVVALDPPAATVTNLQVTAAAGSGNVTVAWTPVNLGDWRGATHNYKVDITGPGGEQLSNNTCATLAGGDATAATGCTFTTDKAGTYAVTVTSVNEVGDGPTSAPDDAHVTLAAPAGPVTSLTLATTPPSGTVNVTWDQLPSLNWNDAQTREYTVTVTGPGAGETITGTCVAGAVADGATPGCQFSTDRPGVHTVTVVAHSEAGDSSPATATRHVTITAPTGTVTGLNATAPAGPGVVDVTWDQLSGGGWAGGQTREYTVTATGPGAGETITGTCVAGAVADSASPGCQFTTDRPGTYTITVAATSEAGSGATATDTVAVALVPTASVAGLGTSVTNGTVTVTWTQLTGSGMAGWAGGTDRRYQVGITGPAGATYLSDTCTTNGIPDAPTPSCTFAPSAGGDYTVRVGPVTEAGVSTGTAASTIAHVVRAPVATVTGLRVLTTPGSADVVVVWNRAATAAWNGAVTTTNYVVTVEKPAGAVLTADDCAVVADSSRPGCAFTTDLSGPYTVRVALANEAGTSANTTSATGNVSISAPTAAPATVTVDTTAGSGVVLVRWDQIAAGAWQGVTRRYTVTVAGPPGAAALTADTCTTGPVVDTATPQCTFTAGTAGEYTVTVTAVNETGASSQHTDDTGQVTLTAPTGQVTNLDVATSAGSGVVQVSWDQLPQGGWAAGQTRTYLVTVDAPAGATVTGDNCTTGAIADGATPGCQFTTNTAGAYTVHIRAHNEVGNGPETTASGHVTLTVPTGTVTGLAATTTTPGVVNVTWSRLPEGGWAGGQTRRYTVTVAGPGGNHTGTCTTGPVADGPNPGCQFTTGTSGVHTIAVAATNEVGTAVGTADTTARVVFTPTAAVTGLVLTPATGSPTVPVSWDRLPDAAWQAGQTRAYTVTVTGPAGAVITPGTCATVADGPEPGCSFTTDRGGAYTVTVAAANEAGSATPVATASATLHLGAPGVPTAVTAVAGTNAATVSWSAPAETGSGLAGYTVTASADDYPDRTCPAPVTVSPCTIANLAAGVEYTIRVTATGPGGISGAATAGGPVTAAGVAQAPAEVPADIVPAGSTTTPTGGTVTITGSGFAPGSTVVLTLYSTPQPLGTAVADINGTISATVTLPAGSTTGSHTLLATGVDGNGEVRHLAKAVTVTVPPPTTAPTTPPATTPPATTPPATTPPATTPPATTPPATTPPTTTPPVLPTGTAGALTAAQQSTTSRVLTVTWTAGTVSWGTGANRRYVLAVTGPAAVPGCTTPAGGTGCTITVPADGAYQLRVTAVTDAGSSTTPASATVTVATTPGTPGGVTADAGQNAITVVWSAPSATGTITGYTATAVAANYPARTCTAPADRSTCTVAGLAAGAAYTVRVTASGPAGTSAAGTAPTRVVPSGAVQVPAAVPAEAVAGGQSATVTAGGTVAVAAAGFRPGTKVLLTLYPGQLALTTATATGSGAANATIRIPATVRAGRYTVLFTGLNADGTGRFRTQSLTVRATRSGGIRPAAMAGGGGTVTRAVPAAVAGTNGGAMPVTGYATEPVLLAGVVFVLAGLVLIVTGRHRRRRG